MGARSSPAWSTLHARRGGSDRPGRQRVAAPCRRPVAAGCDLATSCDRGRRGWLHPAPLGQRKGPPGRKTTEHRGQGSPPLLVASAGPISLDRPVAIDPARPTEPWRWLEGARADGAVGEDAAGGAGCFDSRGEARRIEVHAAARPEDWAALVGRKGAAAAMVAAARVGLQVSRFGPAAITPRYQAIRPVHRASASAPGAEVDALLARSSAGDLR